jgi:ribosomal protein L40E
MQKECRECRTYNPANAASCEACGYKFLPREFPLRLRARLARYALAAAVGLLAAVLYEVFRRLA